MHHILRLGLFIISYITCSQSFANITLPADKVIDSQHSAMLVELYTSQGCSSCPPAEKYLNAFSTDVRLWKEIIPVAFHVDYWNYLGWKDPYASSAFSQRQRQYLTNNNINSVYTPGFVINGQEWRGYFYRKPLPKNTTQGRLKIVFSRDTVNAEYFITEAQLNKPLIFNVAILGVGIETKITRGENEDRTLKQDFTVLKHIQRRSGKGKWTIKPILNQLAKSPRYAVAFWVQDAKTLDVLHATGDWL